VSKCWSATARQENFNAAPWRGGPRVINGSEHSSAAVKNMGLEIIPVRRPVADNRPVANHNNVLADRIPGSLGVKSSPLAALL